MGLLNRKRLALLLPLPLLAYAVFFAVETLRPRTVLLDLPVPKGGLLPGDVVLMRSHTWRAEAVRLIDGQPRSRGFSHVGLIHNVEDGVPRLVHAVPGEGGEVRLEPWPSIARGGGSTEAVVYRADGLDTGAAKALQADLAARAVPFDAEFDLGDADALYCTELVTHVHALAGNPELLESVSAKGGLFPQIFPGDLAAAPSLREVARSQPRSIP